MDALSTTSSMLNLPPSFITGACVGVVGYSISWFGFKVALNTFSTDEFKDRIKKLDERARLNFLSLGPSTVHAVAQVIGTYNTVFKSQSHLLERTKYFIDSSDNGITNSNPTLYSGIFVGYLISDVVAIGIKNLGNVFVVHHISASAAWILVVYHRTMQWYSSFLQFNELSTIFVNLRQLLLTAGYTSSSTEVTISSLAMFIVFGAIRVLPLPWIIYNWITTDAYGVYEKVGTVPAILCSCFMAIHVCLQSYWFSLMAKKFISFLFGSSKDKDKKKKE